MNLSLFKPLESSLQSVSITQEGIIQEILDEVLYECSSLIADIENRKVDPLLLKNEIHKRVDAHKGIFKPEAIKDEIYSIIYGYGILEVYVEDETYSDIDIPRYDYVLGKKNGHIEKLPIVFESELVFERFCKLLIIRHGGVINAVDSHCRVSDRLKKLRINVCISPRNVLGTSLNIRKHRTNAYTYAELLEFDFIDREAYEVLVDMNQKCESFVICGKGGSGKTTLMRTLIESTGERERVLICESDAEIFPQKKNVIVQQIVKSRNHHHDVTLDLLIQEGLTMSLDAYCIGEITGAEAWPFVKAGHTDHRIMGTLHSSGARDALDRLFMLVENETRIAEKHLKEMIAHGIHKIIYVKNFKLVEIIEVKAYDVQNECFNVETVYHRRRG